MRPQTVGRVATLALALLMAPQAGKVYRIGILGQTAADPSEARLWQAFGLALRIASRWAEDNVARLPALAAELVQLKVDLIVTRGSIFVEGAKKATASIPSSSPSMPEYRKIKRPLPPTARPPWRPPHQRQPPRSRAPGCEAGAAAWQAASPSGRSPPAQGRRLRQGSEDCFKCLRLAVTMGLQTYEVTVVNTRRPA